MRISDWSSDVCSSDLMFRIAEMALLGTVGILVLLLVVRPLMARLLETPAPADAVEQQMLLAGQPQPMAALTGPTMSSETGDDMEDGSAIQQEDNMIDVKQVEGRVKDRKSTRLNSRHQCA